MTIRPLSVVVALVLALGFSATVQAKPRRDAGCYDRCDRGLLACRSDAASCERDRRSCVLACDPNPSRPSAQTVQRLNQSEDQLYQRLSATPNKLSVCEVHCENGSEACGLSNDSTVCRPARAACIDRCRARQKPR